MSLLEGVSESSFGLSVQMEREVWMLAAVVHAHAGLW